MIRKFSFFTLTLFATFVSTTLQAADSDIVQIGVFNVDASPPVGSPLAYDPVKKIQIPLSCRGIVITGKGKPIVLCAVDWIGIGSGGQDFFKDTIARAINTDPLRVAVHTLHQHDAPRCNFSAEKLLKEEGISGAGFNPDHARSVAISAAAAVKEAMANLQPVTHMGTGIGIIEKVASNRRIIGPDGKCLPMRGSSCKNKDLIAYPVGTIDPEVKMITFWNGDKAITALTYYATHPQSYYRTGLANPDFPGMARNAREKDTGIPHIHFNGAGGNIAAGKWNNGDHKNRQILADRVALGMKKAWENTNKVPLPASAIGWEVEPVLLPVAKHVVEEDLMKVLKNKVEVPSKRYFAAKNIMWLRRCQQGKTIPVGCLTLGDVRILHLPGELFVEYQLKAQKLRPDLFVAMAAYGDYAPGYIGTAVAYPQGGYETSPGASKVSPEVESVLMNAIKKLLKIEKRAGQTIQMTEPVAIAADPKIHYGFPRVIRAKDGRLLLFYRVGKSHASDASTIIQQTSHDEGATWSDQRVIYRDPDGFSAHNPVASVSQEGQVILFVSSYDWKTPAKLPMYWSHSDDHGETWVPFEKFDTDPSRNTYYMTDILNTEEGMFGMSAGFGKDAMTEAHNLFWFSKDGRDWEMRSVHTRPDEERGDEVDLFQTGPGKISVILRDRRHQSTYLNHSDDGGRTWSDFKDIGNQVGILQRPFITRLSSKSLLLSGRDKLTRREVVYVSRDNGNTFGEKFVIDRYSADGGYTSAVKLSDKKALLVYYGDTPTTRGKPDIKQVTLSLR